MIDTSVLIAGLVENHMFHKVARPAVVAAAGGRLPGIVLAETWSALRRAPWNLDATTVARGLLPWMTEARIVATPAMAYASVLQQGTALNMGGSVHDLLIAQTCADAGLPLTTLDRRQAMLARSIPGLSVTLLLPDEPEASDSHGC